MRKWPVLIHIVCWKYRADVSGADREEHRRRLKELSRLVPNIARLDVGADILHLDRSFDTALVAAFESRKALDSYTGHPEHQTVAAMGRDLAEKAVSVDFWA